LEKIGRRETTLNPISYYIKSEIELADQRKLILLLYSRAISLLKEGIKFLKEKDFENSHKNFSKARRIIVELLSSLNLEVGEIAKNLQSLYVYMMKKIMEANLKKSISPAIEVISLLEILKEAWENLKLESSLKRENNKNFVI